MSKNQSESQQQSNRLNLFKFGSRRKSSNNDVVKTKSREDEDPMSNSSDYFNINTQNNTRSNSINTEDDPNVQSYPPSFYYDNQVGSQTHLQSPTSPSESSLIFERSVEDPTQPIQQAQNTCSRCQTNNEENNSNNNNSNNNNNISNSPNSRCNHQSVCNLPSHYSVENFVSPCLDATTKILTDENTDLDNVDMVYSRRPSSVMGLNMALGRNKSFSGNVNNMNNMNDDIPTGFSAISRNNSNLNITKTNSLASIKDSDNDGSNPKRPPTLSFYSYADMINNENPNPKRPSISQSLSSSFINSRQASRSNSITASAAQQQRENILNNNSLMNNNSITPQRNTRMNSRSSFSNPFNSNLSMPKKNFQITPDSPNSSDSENEYNSNQQLKTNLRSKRNSMTSNKSGTGNRLNKSYSNQSSNLSTHNGGNNQNVLNSPNSNVSSSPSSLRDRRFSNLDEQFYNNNNSSDNDSLAVSSIGDHLRRNNGEIKSSNNSIIA